MREVFEGFCTAWLEDSQGNARYFHTLTSSGFKTQGSVIEDTFKTAEEAHNAYQKCLEVYKASHRGDIYWRHRPELITDEGGSFYVYSRLLISEEKLQEPQPRPDPLQQSLPDLQENLAHSCQYLEHGWRSLKKGPRPENTSGFRAVGHRILLKPDPVEKKSEGGIVLVEKTVQAEENIAVIATVIEIGHDAWRDKSTDYCEVGDRVLIGQYVGKFHTSPIDGEKYRFVQDLDIISPLPPEAK